MSGINDEGFPVRYAAAWALVNQYCNPIRRTPVGVEAIAAAAEHQDPRLAGPAIIALTMLGASAHEVLIKVISHSPHREDAAVLALIVTRWMDTELHAGADQMVPADHPVRSLINEVSKYSTENGDPVSEIMKHWVSDLPVADWLSVVADCKDLHPAIRFALGQLTRDNTEVFVKWGEYREHDLAHTMPVLTTWQMAGGS